MLLITLYSCERQAPCIATNIDYIDVYKHGFGFFKATSSNGLTMSYGTSISGGPIDFEQKNCELNQGRRLQARTSAELYDFSVILEFQSAPGHSIFDFSQTINLGGNEKRSFGFRYLTSGEVQPVPLSSTTSMLNLKIEKIDTLEVGTDTFYHVKHFEILEDFPVPNEILAKDLYIDNVYGLIQFETVKGIVWDMHTK